MNRIQALKNVKLNKYINVSTLKFKNYRMDQITSKVDQSRSEHGTSLIKEHCKNPPFWETTLW